MQITGGGLLSGCSGWGLAVRGGLVLGDLRKHMVAGVVFGVG